MGRNAQKIEYSRCCKLLVIIDARHGPSPRLLSKYLDAFGTWCLWISYTRHTTNETV